jgi:hypothetical protein
MNPWIGWALAALAFFVGWRAWGWQGVVLAFSVVAFWLLLQFTRISRVMRRAGEAPIGHVASAVMLHSKLHAGMPLIDVLRLTGSLGRKTAEAPETFAWVDPGGAEVQVVFEGGRCARWTLQRGEDGGGAAAEPAPPTPN